MVYDIFLSYPRVEHDQAHALKVALEALGLSVWMDREGIRDGAPVTETIVQGLARSRVLLAWYAPAYALSRPCQWELTAAYLAAQHDGGKVGQRLLIVNPVDGTAHVAQTHLKDCQHLSGRVAVVELAARVRDAVDRALPPFAHIRALDAPPWPAGSRRSGSNRFVGRLRELWDIHNGLIAGDLAVISGKPAGNDLVRVHGMGGIGKSLLAEEYALRFGAAYPGGIFWLSASPPDTRTTPEQQYQGQMLDLAQQLGMEIKGRELPAIEGALRRKLEGRSAYLWVVDDLPAGAKADLLHRWRAPSAQGKTLITSRSGGWDGNGQAIPLEQLDDDAAFALLTSRQKPRDAAEIAAAKEILALLGNHALAVDVTGAALKGVSYAQMLDELKNPTQDALDLAAKMAKDLPNGHEASVAATLLHSITRLDADAQRVLQLVSLLAVEPIPCDFLYSLIAATGDGKPVSPLTAALPLDAAADEGLLERVDNDTIAAHILVSRTIRFHQPASEEMRRMVVGVMNWAMQHAKDIREHYRLAPLLPHALTLVEGVEDVETATLLHMISRFEYERGAYAAAAGFGRRVWDICRTLLGDEHPNTLTAMSDLASSFRLKGDFAGARALQEQVLLLRRKVLGDSHPDTQTSVTNLAITLLAMGDSVAARELLEQVLLLCRKVLGDDHPDTLKAMNNLAETLHAMGDSVAARELHLQVLPLTRKVQGYDHPYTLAAMSNLAITLLAMGDSVAARELLEQALPLCRKVHGAEHPDTLRSMHNLAETLASMSDFVGARQLQEQVLLLNCKVQGTEHPDTVLAMNNLAGTLARMGDFAGARQLQEQVLRLRRKVLGNDHPYTLGSINNLAFTLWHMGEQAAALRLQVQAHDGAVRVLGPDHPNTRKFAETLQQMRDAGPS